MGIETIHATAVAKSDELRIDPHHYILRRRVEWLMRNPRWGIRLEPPFLSLISNGVNLPRSAYASDEDSSGGFIYTSVGAISQFTLRVQNAQALRDPGEYRYNDQLSSLVAQPSEVLISRSGTPGIAWPVAARPEDCPDIVPSGFLIRATVNGDTTNATYLAATLNHPAWRLWSASLAAGKRQRNLSQEQLQTIRVPRVPDVVRNRLATTYLEALHDIDRILAEERTIRGLCDDIISEVAGLRFRRLHLRELTCDAVTLLTCSANPTLRMDGRFHRSDVRSSLVGVFATDSTNLGSLFRDVIRNGQPTILVDDEDQAADTRVIATSSIQSGQIVYELTKATDPETIEAAGPRTILSGDLLVAMDGEGSIGKVAVFDQEYLAVPDSHVGILRGTDPDVGRAVSCFLNSSLGQAQFMVEVTSEGV